MMNVDADGEVSMIAAAIGGPARARMLYCLLDGRARTATELAAIAALSSPTTSSHLRRLERQLLVTVVPQGKHRYYTLNGASVAAALEALSVLAGAVNPVFVPTTPDRLRTGRTCYDHIAGTLGVSLHDCLLHLEWICPATDRSYDVTPSGVTGLEQIGIDVAAARAKRRRFAIACLDWSERRYHLGGALGAALLAVALTRKWIVRDLDSRIVSLTAAGRRELQQRLSLELPS